MAAVGKALAVWEKFPAAAFVMFFSAELEGDPKELPKRTWRMFFSAELEGDPKELPLPVPVRDQYCCDAMGDGKIECLPSLV